ncbi:unnamed protein product [Prorocentrum cordatum]|uniref:Uncharacterized protein n=1 Tax=Prorocentrum cordatum TaxID=2364126 RepID=A0ABN9UKV6_9DINO|nr:unnamed protein product [Polarella glacialis]
MRPPTIECSFCLPLDAGVWVEGRTITYSLRDLGRGQRVLCYDSLGRSIRYVEVLEKRVGLPRNPKGFPRKAQRGPSHSHDASKRILGRIPVGPHERMGGLVSTPCKIHLRASRGSTETCCGEPATLGPAPHLPPWWTNELLLCACALFSRGALAV